MRAADAHDAILDDHGAMARKGGRETRRVIFPRCPGVLVFIRPSLESAARASPHRSTARWSEVHGPQTDVRPNTNNVRKFVQFG